MLYCTYRVPAQSESISLIFMRIALNIACCLSYCRAAAAAACCLWLNLHARKSCTALLQLLLYSCVHTVLLRLAFDCRSTATAAAICCCKYVYVKYDLRLILARCSPAAERFFSHFRPRGKLACHGYIMKHAWISAELRGGARRIKRRLARSMWQRTAFRLPETCRSLGTPQIVFKF